MTDGKITLLVMAAGMGSRYGSLKQIDPVDREGDVILDFSVRDAVDAGFEKVVFVIQEGFAEEFRKTIGARAASEVQVCYAFQDLHDLPEGFSLPEEGRKKPWGTAHAVWSARDVVGGPFAVINADDFYGRGAFRTAYDFLKGLKDAGAQGSPLDAAMVSFLLKNTLSDSGSVSRGICTVDKEGFLLDVTERTRIEKREGGAAYQDEEGSWQSLKGEEPVSMNFWAFPREMMEGLEAGLKEFLSAGKDLERAECYLPSVVDAMVKRGLMRVKVLQSRDQWYGVTYQSDKPVLFEAVSRMKKEGIYPEKLFERWEGSGCRF